ncbi:heavy-metal-associated domain-containing protein [Kordia sp. YSTF-M3]|uniref:Heavy-metal-associated domain-containing protein n=1 Tax=Kordia aestuariivivens TaxID=2759037 RepID=A0ABR7QBC4_9FLAO|nr:heavy-metal-associated domain-containing protein [Kordia aestuariivivens]MBC8755879.1 heavy-metal-associated domain-containing protein [Kordia aestuariivivens]
MRKTVHIQNLVCDTCVKIITNRLTELRNISNVDVNLEKETVSFDFFAKRDFEHAKHALEALGYPILGHDNILNH